MDFRNKVALVTGATRGMGRGIATAFAKEGAKVVVNGTKEDLCYKVADEIKRDGGECFAIPGDISKPEIVHKTFEKLFSHYKQLDILVNNAGISYVKECIDTPVEKWDRIMEVNCRGVFLCSKGAAAHMVKRKSGKIINIASQGGKTGWEKQSHYCASKFAVIGFTQSLSKELAPYGINVNAVCPGIVDTDMLDEEIAVYKRITKKSEEELRNEFLQMVPLKRFQTTEDIANLVLFLTSDKACSITGQSINITGGMEVH